EAEPVPAGPLTVVVRIEPEPPGAVQAAVIAGGLVGAPTVEGRYDHAVLQRDAGAVDRADLGASRCAPARRRGGRCGVGHVEGGWRQLIRHERRSTSRVSERAARNPGHLPSW